MNPSQTAAPSASSQQSLRSHQKSKFSPEEDCLLTDLVSKYGENDWNTIAQKMNGRNIRQVRDRWRYYLSPDVSNAPWTPYEDYMLKQKFMVYGPKWKKIAEFFPNRTYINIKNRHLYNQRHFERITTEIAGMSSKLSNAKRNMQKKVSTSPKSQTVAVCQINNNNLPPDNFICPTEPQQQQQIENLMPQNMVDFDQEIDAYDFLLDHENFAICDLEEEFFLLNFNL